MSDCTNGMDPTRLLHATFLRWYYPVQVLRVQGKIPCLSSVAPLVAPIHLVQGKDSTEHNRCKEYNGRVA